METDGLYSFFSWASVSWDSLLLALLQPLRHDGQEEKEEEDEHTREWRRNSSEILFINWTVRDIFQSITLQPLLMWYYKGLIPGYRRAVHNQTTPSFFSNFPRKGDFFSASDSSGRDVIRSQEEFLRLNTPPAIAWRRLWHKEDGRSCGRERRNETDLHRPCHQELWPLWLHQGQDLLQPDLAGGQGFRLR